MAPQVRAVRSLSVQRAATGRLKVPDRPLRHRPPCRAQGNLRHSGQLCGPELPGELGFQGDHLVLPPAPGMNLTVRLANARVRVESVDFINQPGGVQGALMPTPLSAFSPVISQPSDGDGGLGPNEDEGKQQHHQEDRRHPTSGDCSTDDTDQHQNTREYGAAQEWAELRPAP